MKETFLPIPLSKFPVDVPLLPTIEYDFAGLNDFPTRHGIMSSGLDELNYRPAEYSASFVQSWLFFGLLADLTGTLVDRDNVLHPAPHQRNHGTQWPVCPPTLQHNELGLRTTSSSEESNLKSLSRKLRSTVRVGIYNVGRIDRLLVAEKHPMPHILLSVKILLCNLAAIRVGRSGMYSLPWDNGLEEPRLVPYHTSISSIISPSAKILQGLMKGKGWCPSQIHRVGSTCDYSMMHYLSNIDRRASEKMIHDTCSSRECQAYNSGPDSYVTSHTTRGCQCSFIAAPTEQVNEIIRSGGVPLISLRNVSHGKIEIRVHASRANSSYTAMSHVWSGGLGNVQGNSLPLCQLEYLDKCVSNMPRNGERGLNYKEDPGFTDLTGKVWISPLGLDNLVSSKGRDQKLFWIDTLCIPVSPESSDLRMKAINKMDAVYAHAREVLVLDVEIQRLSIKKTHPCELLARLAYSSWMGRSWTLQEGAIGRATYFQCADGAMTLQRSRLDILQRGLLSMALLGFRELRSVLRHKTRRINFSESAISQCVGHDRVENISLKMLVNPLHRGRDRTTISGINMAGLVPENQQLLSFVSVWNELNHRSTTKPEDTFAIFANLLDFNAGQIISLPQRERMKAILWSSEKIPFSLLFNTGSRINDGESHRDRWVPAEPKGSKLNQSPSLKFAEDGRSFCLTDINAESQPLTVTAQVDSLPLYCYLLDTQDRKTYFVKAIRSAKDTMSIATQHGICVVMDPLSLAQKKPIDHYATNIAPFTRGACLFVTSRTCLSKTRPGVSEQHPMPPLPTHTQEKHLLSTTYDCPVRIWEVKDTRCIPRSESRGLHIHGGLSSCPIIQCAIMTPGYEMHLETGICDLPLFTEIGNANNGNAFTDTPRPEKRYARRTLPTNPSVTFLNASIFGSLLFLCSAILPLIFFAITCAREDGHFAMLGGSAILCYILSWSPLSVVLSPVSAILVIVDRIQRNELDAVTIAFVAFTFGGLLPGALYAIVWDVALRDYAYKAWLAGHV